MFLFRDGGLGGENGEDAKVKDEEWTHQEEG
jgi:hypothetical protein